MTGSRRFKSLPSMMEFGIVLKAHYGLEMPS